MGICRSIKKIGETEDIFNVSTFNCNSLSITKKYYKENKEIYKKWNQKARGILEYLNTHKIEICALQECGGQLENGLKKYRKGTLSIARGMDVDYVTVYSNRFILYSTELVPFDDHFGVLEKGDFLVDVVVVDHNMKKKLVVVNFCLSSFGDDDCKKCQLKQIMIHINLHYSDCPVIILGDTKVLKTTSRGVMLHSEKYIQYTSVRSGYIKNFKGIYVRASVTTSFGDVGSINERKRSNIVLSKT
jgi:mRNA deadenylase 3'-5' endonuclease subunit Ccr4